MFEELQILVGIGLILAGIYLALVLWVTYKLRKRPKKRGPVS